MDICVWAEMEAAQLLWPPYGCKGGSPASGVADMHEAGNIIIVLAERIKAERAVATMQRISTEPTLVKQRNLD